ncbi:MAG: NAD-binding protein [Chloroflexi bacterium]|nr:NAD-binding protein [Chloroflexota bacterium]
MNGHVVLCDLNGLSVRTLEGLVRLGERVVVVVDEIEPRFLKAAESLADRIVRGSPRDQASLLAADITAARAAVFTAEDDVANLDAALAAHELAPGLRIVIRIFEEQFGRQVESLFGDCTALSASALAAPGFVASALHEDAERSVEIAGRRFVVRAADPGAPEVVLPLARLTEDGTLDAFPDRADSRRGEVLCLVEPAAHDAAPAASDHRRRARRQRLADLLPGLRDMLRATDRRLRYLTLVLLLMFGVSTVVFSVVAGKSLIDALFISSKAFSFGGIDSADAVGDAIKLFSIFLTFLGAVTFGAMFTLLADAVLGARLARVLEPNVRRLSGHVVVCGLGTIGYRIVEELLAQGLTVVAAEVRADGRFVEAARRLGARVVITDARDSETLRTLNIAEARCLIVATSDDAANLEISLHARTVAPKLRIVVRLFDAQLAGRLERAFGRYVSRSLSTLAAPAFAAAAVGREVLLTIPVGPRVLVVARGPIEAGSPADGSTVGDEEEAVAEAEILALETPRGRSWRPDAATPMVAGDSLVFVGTRAGMAAQLFRTEATRTAVA